MDTQDQTVSPVFLEEWYRFTAEQPWAVDAYLRVLRTREGKTLEQQQQEFGAGNQEFLQLRGMPLPRPHLFRSDAQRIAEACRLQFPLQFVSALLLARNLLMSQPESGNVHSYEAAFDAPGEPTLPPEKE